MEYKRIHATANNSERRADIFANILGELKAKADDMKAKLEVGRTKDRNENSEVNNIEVAYEETMK